MSSIWYHAGYDEIWLKFKDWTIERGCQAVVETQYGSVRDYLGLWLWKPNQQVWNIHRKIGWLIELEEEVKK